MTSFGHLLHSTATKEEEPTVTKRKISSPNVDVETNVSFEVSYHAINDNASSANDLDSRPATKKIKIDDKENELPSVNVKAGMKGKEPVKLKKTPAKKKTPTKRRTKFQIFYDKLMALGMSFEGKGNCALAALFKRKVKLSGDFQADLDQVVFSDILQCGHNCSATLKDLLEQPDCGEGDYCYENGQQNVTVFCDDLKEYGLKNNEFHCRGQDEECGGRTYISHICAGYPTPDTGKYHKHCTLCSNFGECLGDYREAHCESCGKHYTCGSMKQFKCFCQPKPWGYGDQFDDEMESFL